MATVHMRAIAGLGVVLYVAGFRLSPVIASPTSPERQAVLSAECALSLPAEVAGACDFLNSLLVLGKLQSQFAVAGTTASFGINGEGVVQIHATVLVFHGSEFVPAKVTYRFSIKDVEVAPPGVSIDCKNQKPCMSVGGSGVEESQITFTKLVSADENPQTTVDARKAVLLLISFFATRNG